MRDRDKPKPIPQRKMIGDYAIMISHAGMGTYFRTAVVLTNGTMPTRIDAREKSTIRILWQVKTSSHSGVWAANSLATQLGNWLAEGGDFDGMDDEATGVPDHIQTAIAAAVAYRITGMCFKPTKMKVFE